MTARLARKLVPSFALALLAGCGPDAQPASTHPEPPATAGPAFDASRCGRVAGRIVAGADLVVPVSNNFIYGSLRPDRTFDIITVDNPHNPKINPAGRGLAEAVVFLRGVPPAAAKAWDLPPVEADVGDNQIVIRQGGPEPRRAGFVRRGASVAMQSRVPTPQTLRAAARPFSAWRSPTRAARCRARSTGPASST